MTGPAPDPLRGAGPSPEQDPGFDIAWLDLREGSDAAALSLPLVVTLAEHLGTVDRAAGEAAPHLLDIGSGTGSMVRRLAAHLPAGARWSLVDPDPALLAVAAARCRDRGVAARTRVGDVAGLRAADLVDVDAVVCSALLDVLPVTALRHLVDVVAEARVPLLAALTITGEVGLDPAHPADHAAATAVARTATAHGAAGAAAAPAMELLARARGLVVTRHASTWTLAPGRDDALLDAWTRGWVAAVLEGAAAEDRDLLTAWADARLAAAAEASLHVVVEHVDLLLTSR